MEFFDYFARLFGMDPTVARVPENYDIHRSCCICRILYLLDYKQSSKSH